MILMDHLNSPIPQTRADSEWDAGRTPETGNGFGWERLGAEAGPGEERR